MIIVVEVTVKVGHRTRHNKKRRSLSCSILGFAGGKALDGVCEHKEEDDYNGDTDREAPCEWKVSHCYSCHSIIIVILVHTCVCTKQGKFGMVQTRKIKICEKQRKKEIGLEFGIVEAGGGGRRLGCRALHTLVAKEKCCGSCSKSSPLPFP